MGDHHSPARFGPGALTFFRHLKRNNTKPWFVANRGLYESEVRGPLRALVEEMDVRFARFAPEIVGDPKKAVITSYSIHYTKLYDIWDSISTVTSDSSAGLASRVWDDIPVPCPMTAAVRASGRITSYNVCYTKLLR